MYRAGSVRSVLSDEYELELGGHTVYPGSRVNVKWKGIWYDGTITKIGPNRQMCQVRDLASNHTLLLEQRELKLMDSHALESSYSPGSRVAYNDGDSWLEGVIESSECTGAALVGWRPSVHVSENLNWFEISDLAPVIDNEAYLANNEDLLEAGKSGLLQNDTIEPRPKERENVLYQSDDSDVMPAHQLLSRSSVKQEDERFYHVLDENQPPQHRIPLTSHASHTSHTYEEIRDEEHFYHVPNSPTSPHSPKHHTAEKKPKSPSHKHSQGYDHPHTLPHPHTFQFPPPLPPPQTYFPPPFIAGPWGMYQTLPYQPTMMQPPMSPYPPRRPLSPVRLPPNKTLEQSSLPVAWSYTAHYRNGIPPHSSSTFFQQLWGKFSAPIRNRSKVMPRKMSSPGKGFGELKKSPSNISKAASEPVYTQGIPAYLSHVEAIPPRDVTGKSLFNRRPKEKSPKIPKIEEEKTLEVERELSRSLSPAPYEVPIKKADLSQELEEVDGGREADTKKKSRKKEKKSPKKTTSAIEEADGGRETDTKKNSRKKEKKSPKKTTSEKDSAKALTIVSSSQPNVSANVGATTLLSCLATGGKKVTYQWRMNEEKLPSKTHPNKVVTAPGFLEIRKCTPADEGLYSCTVSNKWGTSTRSFQLTVVRDISHSPSSPSGLPSSPQVAVPAGGVSPLQSSFNNKVTYAELSLPVGADGDYEPESVQQFLDSLVEEIHISDDEFDMEDYSMFDKGQLPQRPPGDGQAVTDEEEDKATSLPQIVVTTDPSKSTRHKRKRLSNAVKNDNEDYLVGYGQDYGAISSATDLEKEGLSKYADKDIAKKLKERDKKKSNSDTKEPKAKKKFNLFSKSAKKSREEKQSPDEVLEYKDISSPTQAQYKDVPSPTQAQYKDISSPTQAQYKDVPSPTRVRFKEPDTDPTNKRGSGHTDVNSMGVNTSLGSEQSESSLVGQLQELGGVAEERLQLPVEEATISEQVARLQRSVEEYREQEHSTEKGKKSKGVFSKFSKRTKS